MQGKLYTGMWLPLSWELKTHIAAKYNIIRTGASHVITQNGKSKISSDGYTDSDLSKVDVAFLQIVLNTEDKDFFSLWSKFINKMEDEIKPKPVSLPKPEEKLAEKPTEVSVSITVNKEGEVMPEKTKVERKSRKTYAENIKTSESGTEEGTEVSGTA